jgi:hypothetical protein
MRRSTAFAFVILGAALAGIAFSSAAVRLRDDSAPAEPSVAAGPQTAELDWRETYGDKGQQLVFEVERIQVTNTGWRAKVGLINRTSVAYRVGDPRATLDRAFGLMLFATGDIAELDRRNREGTLPSARPAVRYEPSLPIILESRASWRGTISAPGKLVAGSWVRVVFGTLLAVGATKGEVDDKVVWITDHAYRLRP